MKLISTITSVAKLPLALAGRLVGAVTGREPAVPAPPTDALPDVAPQAPTEEAPAKQTPAKRAPAKRAPAKKTAAKKAPAKAAAAATPGKPSPAVQEAPAAGPAATDVSVATDLEPSPPPVTDIDAEAEGAEVDVTPADVAASMGSTLEPDVDGGSEDDNGSKA